MKTNIELMDQLRETVTINIHKKEFEDLIKRILKLDREEQREALLKDIELYEKDLQTHIEKTHDTESYEMTDGELARLIMEKSLLLLKEIKQLLKKKGEGEVLDSV